MRSLRCLLGIHSWETIGFQEGYYRHALLLAGLYYSGQGYLRECSRCGKVDDKTHIDEARFGPVVPWETIEFRESERRRKLRERAQGLSRRAKRCAG